MSRLLPLLCLLLSGLLTSCGSFHELREIDVGDRPRGRVWRGIVRVAESDGFRVDPGTTDRGLGVFQTQWRRRHLAMGRTGRRRIHAEIITDPIDEEGLWVRFYVEAQWVEDLSRMVRVEEDDWSDAGQDAAYEQVFANRLVRVLGIVGPGTPELGGAGAGGR